MFIVQSLLWQESEDRRKKAREQLQVLSSSLSSLKMNADKANGVGSRANEAFVVDCSDNAVRSRSNSARIHNNWTENETISEDANEIREETDNEAADKDQTSPGAGFSLAAIVKAKQLARKLAEKHQKEGDIHMIDKLCRILFPMTFIIFNIIYFVIVTTKENS